MSCDQRAAGIRRLHQSAVVAQDGEQRHVWRAPRCVGNPNIQRGRKRMVSYVGRVVARSAEPRDGWVDLSVLQGYIVQPPHAGDGDRKAVEDLLAARNRMPRRSVLVVFAVRDVQPVLIEREDGRREWRLVRIVSQRIIDPQKEIGPGESNRSAGCAINMKWASIIVKRLGGKQGGFERNNLVLLSKGRVLCRLRVSPSGVHRLLMERPIDLRLGERLWFADDWKFTAVKHHGAQKPQ